MAGAHDHEPKLIPALTGLQTMQIEAGEHHFAAIDQNGDLYTWGCTSVQQHRGQLGHGDFKGVEQPKRVTSLEEHRVVKVACGGYHTMALTSDNQLFGFGSNVSGECGMKEAKNLNRPMKVVIKATRLVFDSLSKMQEEEGEFQVPLDVQIKSIAAGSKHSMVLSTDGQLYTFGYGQQGQLGHRSAKNIFQPKFVQDFVGKKIKLIAAGQNHSIVLSQAGDIFVCGSN